MYYRSISKGLTVLLFAALTLPVFGQYPLGGASRPKPQLKLSEPVSQYKRIHQFALRMILRSQFQEMEEFLERHLRDHPEDGETSFLLSVLYSQKGGKEKALHMMQQALQAGLPSERFIAGPRELFRSVSSDPRFGELSKSESTYLIHGPLVGSVTDRGASFWVRTTRASNIVVLASRSSDLRDPVRSEPVKSHEDTDFTAVARIGNLRPETEYNYGIEIDGNLLTGGIDGKLTFRTFPPVSGGARFKIAFGGGAGYVPPHERMWDTIREYDPLAILLLGDNVYIDDPESIAMNLYTYYRRQSRPEFRRLTSRTAVFSIWDDHDFGTNDSWGGPLIDVPFWKKEHSYRIFRQNWANPGYGGGFEQPGCWYSFKMGDVDFIMLDCRYYRTDPKGETPSMLGPVQLDWLKRTLKEKRGVFKVLCSSVPWDFRTKGDSLDTWNGYKEEREVIFRFIEENRIEGIVLMSADRHRSDAWKIERPGGYDFYEFNSSRLTNQHVHPTMEEAGALFSYNALQSFGLVEFDTQASDPTVKYSVVNIDGQRVHELEVKRSELSY